MHQDERRGGVIANWWQKTRLDFRKGINETEIPCAQHRCGLTEKPGKCNKNLY